MTAAERETGERDELLASIRLALRDRDMPLVVALLARLAFVDPKSAEIILTTLEGVTFRG